MLSRRARSLFAVAGLRIAAPAMAVALGLVVSGCGEDVAPPMPAAVLGTYDVDVEAMGKTDHTIMTISQGSNQNVLLNFTMGISTVRCQMIGATMLVLPRQTLHVAHASGVADGQATGGGT